MNKPTHPADVLAQVFPGADAAKLHELRALYNRLVYIDMSISIEEFARGYKQFQDSGLSFEELAGMKNVSRDLNT
jgi:hypothetical protein